MTQSETREFIKDLTATLIIKNCYIKGFGDKFRVMDAEHHALKNISKEVMKLLRYNKIVKLEGLVFVLAVDKSPFVAAIDVKLPEPD